MCNIRKKIFYGRNQTEIIMEYQILGIFGNLWDTGFSNTGFILVRTPQFRKGMPEKITVNTDMYFAQLKVSDAYPTENYVRVMGR